MTTPWVPLLGDVASPDTVGSLEQEVAVRTAADILLQSTINNYSFSDLKNPPTTIAGYGITDANFLPLGETIFEDDFSGPIGPAYQQWLGTWEQESLDRNFVHPLSISADNLAALAIELSADDYDFSITIHPFDFVSLGLLGTIFRGVDANNFMAVSVLKTGIIVSEMLAGVWTFAVAFITFTAGNNNDYIPIRISVHGDVMSLFIGSLLALEYTLTADEHTAMGSGRFAGPFYLGLSADINFSSEQWLSASAIKYNAVLESDTVWLRSDYAPHFSSILGTPTTLLAYGITDVYDMVTSDARFAPKAVPWGSISNTPTTIAGYGITNFNTLGDARWAKVAAGAPALATSAGTAGQFVWDTNFIYICVAANTWKRVAVATF